MKNNHSGRQNNYSRDITICVVSIIVTIIMSVFGQKVYERIFNPPIIKDNILLVGGGTVICYLKDSIKNFEELTKQANLLDAPSKTATDILLNIENDEHNHNNYLQIIAMSSCQLKDSNLLNINYKGQIVEIELPVNNDLMVIVHDTADYFKRNKYLQGNDWVDIREIDTILSKLENNILNFDLFLTSVKSGTRSSFEESIKEIDNNFSWPREQKIKIFDNTENSAIIIKKEQYPYLILCSEYYKPNQPNDYGKELRIANNNSIIHKKLYLYFIKREKDVINMDRDNICTFDDNYLEGRFIEKTLIKGINTKFKFKLLNSFKGKIIKFKIIKI